MLGLGIPDGLPDQDPRLLQQILGPRAHDRIRCQAGQQFAVQCRQGRLPGVARRAGAHCLLEQRVYAIGKAGGSAAHLGDEGVEQAFFPSFRNTVQQAAYRLPHRLQDLGAAEPQRLVHREFGS